MPGDSSLRPGPITLSKTPIFSLCPKPKPSTASRKAPSPPVKLVTCCPNLLVPLSVSYRTNGVFQLSRFVVTALVTAGALSKEKG